MKACLALIAVVLPNLILADGLPTQPYIYVQGEAEVEKPAEMVTIQFSIFARAPEQAAANKEIQAKASQILQLLNQEKVAENDVVAGEIRSEAEYEKPENASYDTPGKLIGYKVTRPFTVKLRDLTKMTKVINDLLAISGLEFSGVHAGLPKEKEKALQDEVWAKALSDARERADKTLKPLGMKIDSVFGVSPIPFPQIRPAIFGGGGEMVAERAAYASEGRRPDPTQYRLAPVTLNQGVHVIYLIVPAN